MEEQVITKEAKTPLNKKVNIVYNRPAFYSRVLANVLDIIILFFTFFLCLWGIREIAVNSGTFKAKDAELVNLKLDSCLYERDANNVLKEVTVFLDDAPEHNAESRKIASKKAVENFITFSKEKMTEENYNQLNIDYKEFRLKDSMVYEGAKMFVLSGEEVVENEELLALASGNGSPIYKAYYEDCYKTFIKDYLLGYLNTKVTGFYDLVKYESNVFIFGEIVPSFFLALIITYFLPGMIFKRGRCTFGKRVYKIASVDSNCLSPKFITFLGKFGLILLEWIIALPSFGIVFLASFTMMAFSKKKQSFPDYVLNLNDVIIGQNKIYIDFAEADLENIETHKEPIDFKL